MLFNIPPNDIYRLGYKYCEIKDYITRLMAKMDAEEKLNTRVLVDINKWWIQIVNSILDDTFISSHNKYQLNNYTYNNIVYSVDDIFTNLYNDSLNSYEHTRDMAMMTHSTYLKYLKVLKPKLDTFNEMVHSIVGEKINTMYSNGIYYTVIYKMILDRIDGHIKHMASLTIQKAYRKYRNDPKYKFYEQVLINNLAQLCVEFNNSAED